MSLYSQSVLQLIDQLAKLPGIGRKTAAKLAYHIINMEDEKARALAGAIIEAKEKVKYCSICFNITDSDPCNICANEKRDRSIICVVQESKDVIAIERTKEFKGLYHVLGGAISPMEGVLPEDLKIKELVTRVGTQDIKEVILATNLNIDGETTAMVIAKILKPLEVKVTRIAKGIPAGAVLEYTDEATLSNALNGRKELI